VDFVKVAQQKFYRFYCDPYVKFEDPTFKDFNAIENLTNNNLPMDWFSDLNDGDDVVYLAFLFFGHKYLIYYIGEDGFVGPQLITKEAFGQVVSKLKKECEKVTWGLMFELEKHFLGHEVMTILGVIYPQF
jgi:hypothetical protein